MTHTPSWSSDFSWINALWTLGVLMTIMLWGSGWLRHELETIREEIHARQPAVPIGEAMAEEHMSRIERSLTELVVRMDAVEKSTEKLSTVLRANNKAT